MAGLVAIGLLSFPVVAAGSVALLLRVLTGSDTFAMALLGIVVWGSIAGFAAIGVAGMLAVRLVRAEDAPRWAGRAAVLMVLLGLAVQCGLAYAIMTPGLVELP